MSSNDKIIETGYFELDDLTKIFQPSDLVVIAARDPMRMSEFVLKIVNQFILNENKSLLFFSLSMPAVNFCLQMLGCDGEIKTKDELETIFKFSKKISNAPLFVDDTYPINLDQLIEKVKNFKQKKSVDMVIIDNLQRVTYNNLSEINHGNDHIPIKLKELAIELSIPVLALVQLPLAVDMDVLKIPILADLMEFGKIEINADVVIFVYHENIIKSEHDKTKPTKVIVAKNRKGPTNTYHLR